MHTNTPAAARSRWRAITSRLSLLALAGVLVGPAACGSDGATGPRQQDDTPAGLYRLWGVDAERLPVEIHRGPWLDPETVHFYNRYVVEVTDGVIELDEEDSSFWMELDYDTNGDGVQGHRNLYVEGTYSIVDGLLMMLSTEGNLGFAEIQSNGKIYFDLDILGIGTFNTFGFFK